MKIKRDIIDELKKHLPKKEISLITGPRQAGKTTLMFFLMEYLKEQKEKTVYLNMDIESDRQFFKSQEKLIAKIELETGKQKGYVFLDEIQRKENAGLFLKGLYDMRLPHKFIVSGSGSIELKEKIHESLAGRKRIFELNTVSFNEFVNFKTKYKYEDNLDDFFMVEEEKSRSYLREYLTFGGYPRVILENSLEEKRTTMDELYTSYLEKDISYMLDVKKVESFSSLVRILSVQSGQIINMSELSSTLGISLPTVKNYLWYLEKTFIISRNTPYFSNRRKEITKAPVVYFQDCGFKNYSSGSFGNYVQTKNDGFLFQNFIYNLLHEKLFRSGANIHFWRTKDGAEVDFVIVSGDNLLPVEVKFKKMRTPRVTRALRNFITGYSPARAVVINLSLSETIKINNTEVEFWTYKDAAAKSRRDFT